MKNILFVFLLICFKNVYSQNINLKLKEELKEIYFLDQIHRSNKLSNPIEKEKLKELLFKKGYDLDTIPSIFELDSINLIEVKKIIKQYGYPGKSLVGDPENSVC